MKLGFIGLGVMGRPMARHLMTHGYEMGVYARRAESAAAVVSAGARQYPSPAALAAASDVVFSMVTAATDVEEIVLGADGLVHGARPGSVYVDMETIAPAVARALAARLAAGGVDMIDAPVSGGPAGAEQATLSIMVGGESRVVERVRPLLECLGKTIVHLGGAGAGQTAKACTQVALLVSALGVAEALALARRSGLDAAQVREVMLGGIAASRVLELFGQRMVDRDFGQGIDTRLYHKDLGIVLDLAGVVGQPLPGAAVVMRHLDRLMNQRGATRDLSALITIVESPDGARDGARPE